MVTHDDLIGAEFEYGGRGPDRYDCFGLLKEMYRRQGVIIPEQISTDDEGQNQARILLNASTQWQKTTQRPGVAVLFRLGRLICHVGFVLDDRYFLHAWEKTGGVTREKLSDWTRRIAGFYDYGR